MASRACIFASSCLLLAALLNVGLVAPALAAGTGDAVGTATGSGAESAPGAAATNGARMAQGGSAAGGAQRTGTGGAQNAGSQSGSAPSDASSASTPQSKHANTPPIVGGTEPGAGGEGAAPTPTAKVQVAAAAVRTLKETVSAYGHLQPDPHGLVNVALPRAGRIEHLWVSPGQRVQADDRLLELRTAPAAAADFAKAQAAVDYARKDLKSLREMFKDHLATHEQVAKAQQNLRDARTALQAQQQLGSGQSSEVLRAPFDGIVTELSVGQGQRVQADTTALVLAKLDALIVILGVEPEEALRLQPGAAVVLSPVFPPTVRIASTVATVHAMVNPKTRLIDTIVRLPPTSGQQLVLDQDVRGTIALREERTLAVPRSAVLRDDRGSYVFVVRAGKAQRIDVETGLQDQDWIGVSGPITAGDPVVKLGNYELSDGMPVRQERAQ